MSRRKKLVATALAVVAALAGYGYVRPVSVLEATGELWLRLSGVRSSYVQAGRYRLRVLEKGSGPPLVLVHGLGSSAMVDWGRLIAPLGRRYHVYALDLPGFGRSERPKDADYSIPMQVEAVRSFMAAAGVSRARVAGISMGGWIVARLAGEHPELVERLVVVAPAGMRPEESAPIPVEVLFPQDEDGMRRLVAAVRHKPPPAPSSWLPSNCWPPARHLVRRRRSAAQGRRKPRSRPTAQRRRNRQRNAGLRRPRQSSRRRKSRRADQRSLLSLTT